MSDKSRYMVKNNRPNIRLDSENRKKRLEELGLYNLSFAEIFDRLLATAEEYRELRKVLQEEVKRDKRELESKKTAYGLKTGSPLEK